MRVSLCEFLFASLREALFGRWIPHAKAQKRTLCRLFITQVSKMAPDPPDNGDCDHDSDDEVETMKPRLEQRVLVPLLAQLLSGVRQAKTPRERSRESVDDELRHLRDEKPA